LPTKKGKETQIGEKGAGFLMRTEEYKPQARFVGKKTTRGPFLAERGGGGKGRKKAVFNQGKTGKQKTTGPLVWEEKEKPEFTRGKEKDGDGAGWRSGARKKKPLDAHVPQSGCPGRGKIRKERCWSALKVIWGGGRKKRKKSQP